MWFTSNFFCIILSLNLSVEPLWINGKGILRKIRKMIQRQEECDALSMAMKVKFMVVWFVGVEVFDIFLSTEDKLES